MKISGTTLFQLPKPQSPSGRREYRLQLKQRLQGIQKADSNLSKALKTLNPKLLHTLVGTSFADITDVEPTAQVLERLQRAVSNRQSAQGEISVGMWDLNAMVSGLEGLLQRLNAAQTRFTFFKSVAAIPAGLISDKERMKSWLQEHKERLSSSDLKDLEDNTIAEDFYPQADKVRRELGLDYLIGITRSMIAFEEERGVNWNYFSVSQGRTLLVSSYGLRDYAEEARRPFEAAVAFVAVAELLATINAKLGFHEPDRGCMFDHKASRDSIVAGLREIKIEKDPCLNSIRPNLRESALALAETLRKEQVTERATRR